MPDALAWSTFALSSFLASAAGAAEAGGDLVRVEPRRIQIGVFYSGRRVRVTASVPAGEEAAIRIAGPKEPLTLKKKGKKYGFLWMNAGDVHYEAVPTLYLLRSSKELANLASRETRLRLELGFDAIRDAIPPDSKDDARRLFAELVKLKERDGLFDCETGGIQWRSLPDGRREASGELFLPAKTPVGDYTVDVFRFRDGVGERIGGASIRLERAPSISFLVALAADHGLLYGCLAVGVAVLAGLFTGVLFGMGKGGSH